MEKEGIEKARNLSERALRVVNYKNERDRLNIWNSYINLEFNFGTEQTLLTTFKKALENNNPKKIYLHLIDLYR
jgi:rRNA biogenesis protein RRP5